MWSRLSWFKNGSVTLFGFGRFESPVLAWFYAPFCSLSDNLLELDDICTIQMVICNQNRSCFLLNHLCNWEAFHYVVAFVSKLETMLFTFFLSFLKYILLNFCNLQSQWDWLTWRRDSIVYIQSGVAMDGSNDSDRVQWLKLSRTLFTDDSNLLLIVIVGEGNMTIDHILLYLFFFFVVLIKNR